MAYGHKSVGSAPVEESQFFADWAAAVSVAHSPKPTKLVGARHASGVAVVIANASASPIDEPVRTSVHFLVESDRDIEMSQGSSM